MARIVYLGGEVDAAGYRLAGAETRAVLPGGERAAVEEAASTADLLLLGAACAPRLGSRELSRLQRREAPLVLVVPDASAQLPEHFGAQLRRELGF